MHQGFTLTTCPTCGSSAIRRVRADWTGSHRGQSYTVKALEYFSCPNCQEKVYPPDAMRRIQQVSPAFNRRKEVRGATEAPGAVEAALDPAARS